MEIKKTGFFEIILMAALIAPCFMLMKIAVQDIAPITLIVLRMLIAGLFLLGLLKLRGIQIPMNWNLWKYCFVIGFLLNGLPFVLLSYSLVLIPSSLAALLNGLTPIITVLLANIALKDEKLTINRMLSVILGLLGFLVLFLPGLLDKNFEFNFMGTLLSFIAAGLYGVGAVYTRRYAQESPPLVTPTLQLLTSLIYLVPAALILEQPSKLLEVSLASYLSITGVAIFGTAMAFVLYHKIVSQYGATSVAMVTYLIPIFGTILGIVFLNEPLTKEFVLAAILILGSLSILNGTIPARYLGLNRERNKYSNT